MSNDSPKMFEDFQNTCQRKWREYLLAHDGYEIELKVVSHFNGRLDTTSLSKTGLKFPCFFGYSRSEYTDDFLNRQKKGNPDFDCEKVEEYLHLINPQYDAHLRGDEAGTWTISQLDAMSRQYQWQDLAFRSLGEQPDDIRKLNLHTILSCFAPGISLSIVEQVAWLIRLPEFKIVAVEEVSEDGIQCLKISYTLNLDEEAVRKYRMASRSSGSLTFLPDSWLLKRADYVARNIQYELEFEYDIEKAAFPLLIKKVLTKSRAGDKPWVEKSEWTYAIHPLSDKSGKCFRLSGYGLPEPDFGERRITLMRLLLLFVGAALVATGAWQMYQKRRERQT